MEPSFAARVLLALLFGLGTSALAQAEAIFPLAEVAPGQQGHGLTAGPGNVLERFSVEILAVQDDMGPGFPLILIRTGGDFIERAGGVAAGMSGSPIYIAGRLLGALAYAFPQSDHRLALVTPAEIIVATDPSAALPQPGSQEVMREVMREVVYEGESLGPAAAVRTPVLVTGLSARAAEELQRLFEGGLFRGDILPLQAGRMSAQGDEDYHVEPGSAVSVQLVRGDVSLAAVGTVTRVDDERVWAFGHPLVERGAVSFALSPAYISHIVPSSSLPFKLANSGRRLLGVINQDRPHGVSGVLGRTPVFIPVSLVFDGPEGSSEKQFEVTSDERFYAPLVFAASLQTIDEALEQLGDGTAELAWEIALAGGRTLRLLEQTADSSDIAASAALLAAAPLEVLADNVFAAPGVKSIKLTVRYDRERRVASVVRAVAENDTLRPGDTLLAHVRLQPFRGEARLETVRVPIPEEAAGPLEITFRGGLEASPEEAAGGENAPLTFGELIAALEGRVQASELVAEAFVNGDYRQLARVRLPFLVEGYESLTVHVLGADEEAEPQPAPEPAEEERLPLPPQAPEPELPPPPAPLPDSPRGSRGGR